MLNGLKKNNNVMKNYLITGVAGFLGSHLAEKILKTNNKVIGLDNFITGSEKNLINSLKNPNFTFIEKDITQPIYLKDKIDYILHFASPASPIDYLKIPIQTLKANSLGTLNLLGLAKQKKSVILLASTSEIYGDPLIHPQNENYFGNVNTVGPRSNYDESKRFMETAGIVYRDFHNVNLRIVRIFNTYGPRMRINDGRVIPAFISQTLQNKEITIFGDGTQTRSFCYVDDLVEGILKLLYSNYFNPVNIGNPEEITISEIANEIKTMTKSESKITFNNIPKDDPKRRKPDISTALKELNWVPKTNRKKGLLKTIEYFKSLTEYELNQPHKNFSKYIIK